MKKVLAFVLFCLFGTIVSTPTSAKWGDSDETSSYFSTSSNATITIAKPGAGKRICIVEFSAVSNNASGFSIMDGPLNATTTNYSVSVSSGLPIAEAWNPLVPLCSSVNSTVTISAIPIGTGYPIGTVYKMNVSGFVRDR